MDLALKRSSWRASNHSCTGEAGIGWGLTNNGKHSGGGIKDKRLGDSDLTCQTGEYVLHVIVGIDRLQKRLDLGAFWRAQGHGIFRPVA